MIKVAREGYAKPVLESDINGVQVKRFRVQSR
jgi:hypothetical protein